MAAAAQEAAREQAAALLNNARMGGNANAKAAAIQQLVEITRRNAALAEEVAPEIADFCADRAPSVRRRMLDALESMSRVCPSPTVLAVAMRGVLGVMGDAAGGAAVQAHAVSVGAALFPAALGVTARLGGRDPAPEPVQRMWQAACACKELALDLAQSEQGSAWVRVAAVRFVELLVRLYTGDTVPAAPAPGAPEPQRLPADHALLGSAEMAREADAKLDALLSLLSSPSSPASVALAAMSAAAGVVGERPRAALRVLPALTRLAQQLGRDWSKAGPGGGTRAASLAHALRVSLVRSMRSTDAMLAAWRGKLARAMEAVGFAAEADKESRAAQRRSERARPPSDRSDSAPPRSSAQEATADAPRPPTPPLPPVSAPTPPPPPLPPHDLHARVAAGLAAASAMGQARDGAAAGRWAASAHPQVLAEVVVALLGTLPDTAPGGAAAGGEPGLVGLIRMLGLAGSGEGGGLPGSADATQPNGDEASRGAVTQGTVGATAAETAKAEAARAEAAKAEAAKAEAARLEAMRLAVSEVPALAPHKLAGADAEALRDAAVMRVLRVRAHGADGGDARRGLLARLAATAGGEGVRRAVVASVVARCRGPAAEEGVDLAVRLLYAVAAGSSQGRASGLGVEGPYAALLGELLGAMREGLRGADAGAARRVLVDAPCLPEGAVGAWLRGAVAGGAPWAGLALAACRDVMLLHPPCRAWVLGAVLGAATGEDEDARDKAGRLVRNRLWEEGTLRGMVEEAVVGELEGVARGTGEGQEQRDQRCVSLFLALCTRNPALLRRAFALFPSLPPHARQALLRDSADLARALGPVSPPLLALLDDLPPGSDPVALRMAHTLTEGETPELLLAILRRRGLLPHGARFLALALPFLSRDEALSHLATLPQLPLSDLRATCTRLCLRSSRPGGPLLSATDLLVALHQLHSEGEALKAQVECLTRCIKDPALQRVFTSDHLRSALPRLAVLAPLPRLLMRTVLLALKEDPSLMTLVLTLLEQLVQRRVWESRDVWRGYVLCCYETRPRSLPVLASLPPQQIADAIAVQPRLAEPMMRLCKAASLPRATVQAIEGAQARAREALAREGQGAGNKRPAQDALPAPDAKAARPAPAAAAVTAAKAAAPDRSVAGPMTIDWDEE